jgi:hypothetical protein
MTDRKRAGLNLSDFQPRTEAPAPLPAETQAIATRAGFTTRHAPPEPPPALRSARQLTRVPIDIPQDVREWLREEAYRRGVTIRAVILEGLRLQGAPVQEMDLVDRRRREG